MMIINPKFKEEWQNILKYNDNFNIREDARYDYEEKIRIPLTNLDIQGYLFYYLNELLYPEFINDQQNILDLIISKDSSKVLDAYFYETKKAGIHERYQKIVLQNSSFQKDSLKNLEQYFTNLRVDLEEKKGFKISSLRIFKEEIFDLINKHYNNMENVSQIELVSRLSGLIQEIYDQGMLYLYPEPNFHVFLKRFFKILHNFDFKKSIESLLRLFPEFNNSVVLASQEYNILLKYLNQNNSEDDFGLNIEVLSQESLQIDDNNRLIKKLLPKIQARLNSDNVYYFYQEDIISILSNIFELEIPFRNESVLLVLQKMIFGLRSFEKKWYSYPRPPVYNAGLRYLIRLLGINVNLKKISHWAIPSFLSNYTNTYVGLISKILMIFTDIKNLTKSELKEEGVLPKAFKTALLLDIRDSSLVSVKQLSVDDLFSDDKVLSLKNIRNNLSKKYGNITLVISMDQAAVKNIVENSIFRFYKFTPFKTFKILKMYKKSYYFNAYPELAPLKLFKEKGSFSILRLMLPILIDKHEF